MAFIRYSKAYVAEEATARSAQQGMWAGAFIAPWDWRSRTDQHCDFRVIQADRNTGTQTVSSTGQIRKPGAWLLADNGG